MSKDNSCKSNSYKIFWKTFEIWTKEKLSKVENFFDFFLHHIVQTYNFAVAK